MSEAHLLTGQELQDFARRMSPEQTARVRALLLPDGAPEASSLLALVSALDQVTTDRETASERLLTALAPSGEVAPPARLLQSRRNRQARTELAREFGLLTSAEVSELAGSRAANASALPTRWRRQGRIFAIEEHGALHYPGFQFGDDGQPDPTAADVVGVLGNRLSPWELALWFTGANGWLDGARPVDLLTTSPDRVRIAAERLAEQLTA